MNTNCPNLECQKEITNGYFFEGTLYCNELCYIKTIEQKPVINYREKYHWVKSEEIIRLTKSDCLAFDEPFAIVFKSEDSEYCVNSSISKKDLIDRIRYEMLNPEGGWDINTIYDNINKTQVDYTVELIVTIKD